MSKDQSIEELQAEVRDLRRYVALREDDRTCRVAHAGWPYCQCEAAQIYICHFPRGART